MTLNVLQPVPELITIAVGALVLIAFAVAMAWPQRPKVLPGSSGQRKEGKEGLPEEIRPEEYIESFSQSVQEARGSVPLFIKLTLAIIAIWWVIYLIVNWTPR